MLPPSMIRRNPDQPRRRFDSAYIEAFAKHLAKFGVDQAIVVRQLPPGEKHEYELIAGELRWRACKAAGIEVPARIEQAPGEARDRHRRAFAENIVRKGLDHLSIALGIKRLMDDFGQSETEVAEDLIHSITWISQHLACLKLHPEIQTRLEAGEIGFTAAYQLSRFPHDEQLAEYEKARGGGLNTGEMVAAVKKAIVDKGLGTRRGRQPTIDERLRRFKSFVSRTQRGAADFSRLSLPQFRLMFAPRDPSVHAKVHGRLKDLIQDLQALESMVSKARP